MRQFLLIVLGLSIGAIATMVLPDRVRRRFVIGLGFFLIAIFSKQLWEISTEWRVKNAPMVSTRSEREYIALIEESKAIQVRLKELCRPSDAVKESVNVD